MGKEASFQAVVGIPATRTIPGKIGNNAFACAVGGSFEKKSGSTPVVAKSFFGSGSDERSFLASRKLNHRRMARRASPGFSCDASADQSQDSTADASLSKPIQKGFLGMSDKRVAELKKLIPMLVMFFAILFNYTILRDTKDVLVVTAPGSGAEAIPFLKTWVVVPAAIGFLVLYTKMSNILSPENLFYATIAPFIAFFGLFASVFYPAKDWLHPTASADWLASVLPAGFAGPIAIYRNWTYAAFYVLSELWGSVVLSLLFWGFANEITKVEEAKSFYPLFGLGANVALVVSGRVVKYLSSVRDTLPAGVDPWGYSLNALMGLVVFGGLCIMGVYWAMNRFVLTDPRCYTKNKEKTQKKKKAKMSVGESFKYLASSRYVRNLAILVMAYGVSINLVEVTWKSKIKAAFPNPNQYSSFMGDFSTLTGVCTLGMMLLSRVIFQRFGWSIAAMITPAVLMVTGLSFFSLILFPSAFAPLTQIFSITPLMVAVYMGAAQNILSKATKYSLFDPTKEMAYIPLDAETKVKGKAAIDVVAARMGKSGGAFLQQILIVSLGSLAASTPILAAVFCGVIGAWMVATNQLGQDFNKAEKERALVAAEKAEKALKVASVKVSTGLKAISEDRCPQCAGVGKVFRLEASAAAPTGNYIETACQVCGGTGLNLKTGVNAASPLAS